MKSLKPSKINEFLPSANAVTETIDEAWTGTNEEWWNWYLTLADNSHDTHWPPKPEALLQIPELIPLQIPSPEELMIELNTPYLLTEAQIEQFQQQSYLRIKEFFSPGALYLLRQEMVNLFNQNYEANPERRFSSMELMWLKNDLVKSFVTSRRLGQLAADLLQVNAVRIYHDDFLCKEPGAGRTPWHFDHHHYPIASQNIGTVWMPLQPTPPEMGVLELAHGFDSYRILEQLPFDKFTSNYDREVAKTLKERGIQVNRSPFELGEISFHHCLAVHAASANCTTTQRVAFGAIYFESGDRVVDSPKLISGDWQKFMPGVQPSEIIHSPYNPVIYDRSGKNQDER